MRVVARRILPGLVAGGLWVLCSALLLAAGRIGGLGSLPQVVFPRAVLGSAWSWPGPWAALTMILGALTVAGIVFALLSFRFRSPGIGAWFCVIVAGTLAGGLTSLGLILADLPLMGLRLAALSGVGDYTAAGAYWGLLYGWIPALIARTGSTTDTSARDAAAVSRRVWPVIVAIVVAVGLMAGYVAVTTAGSRAMHVLNTQTTARTEGASVSGGALPDPYAKGTPVPSVAPTTAAHDPSRCTSEQAPLLLGEIDAASGHRVQPIRMMNVSETSCTIDGYPDVAFADQNGHELNVHLTHGDTFMMPKDPGARLVTLGPGQEAITYIEWSASSTNDALVARKIYAAPVAGDPRGSWPAKDGTDIVEGSDVTVTAWALTDAAG